MVDNPAAAKPSALPRQGVAGRALGVLAAALTVLPAIAVPNLKYAANMAGSLMGSVTSVLVQAGVPYETVPMLLSGRYSVLDIAAILQSMAAGQGDIAQLAGLAPLVLLPWAVLLVLVVGGCLLSMRGRKTTRMMRIGLFLLALLSLVLIIALVVGNGVLAQVLGAVFSGLNLGGIGLEGAVSVRPAIGLVLSFAFSVAAYVLLGRARKVQLGIPSRRERRKAKHSTAQAATR